MAFNPLKRIFGRKDPVKLPPETEYIPAAFEDKRAEKPARSTRAKKNGRTGGKSRRFLRRDASPYTLKPSLARENMARLEREIRKSPGKYRTDRLTLLEVADRILENEIGMPRPPQLRAHHIFDMFVRKSSRPRQGVSGFCLEWRGSYKAAGPVVTTVNSIHGHRLVVDARKYVLENPAKGKRRNFRSSPHNLCGNARCVNPRHIEMRGLPHELKSGENHGRAKFTDKDIVKLVKEYNAGATAKQLAKKYKMSLSYVEQVMRKERRTEATEGMTIRGRFGKY